ncbi:MAG: alcohol dehydrogenase catalytic domain-containing protein [Achromobacter sp.]|nr:alcohol dehydrogenase catalytic domain-containing protein [Achromobacter sp.]
MIHTYRAIQSPAPGRLELVEREMPPPAPGHVVLAVQACGVCGADAADIDHPTMARPRVPGHEVVGRIIALGPQVPPPWRVGQRVGVGRLGGHCNACEPCRQGRFNLCVDQPVVGVDCDGGYAERMQVRATALARIPDELDAFHAAPILCAGIATFNALRKCGAEAGDLVAVLGIGGLGHLALQYARKMGFHVVAIGRGADIARDVLDLGAHAYIDTREEAAGERLRQMGGARALIATIGAPDAISDALTALAPQGRAMLLGVGKDPLSVSSGWLVGGERTLAGSITGTPHDSERTLKFSVLADVRPMIEIVPLAQAETASLRMKSGQAKFRMVLDMEAADAARP